MRIGVRGKLILASFALIGIALFMGGLYLEHNLRDQLEQQIEGDLFRLARTGERWLATQAGPHEPRSLDVLADQLGQAAQLRFTIVSSDGSVLGDSELTVPGIAQMDNHSNRPEILSALSEGSGVSRRFSTTLNSNMLYVALPYAHGQHKGVIRVAQGLAEVDQAIGRLRLFLLVAAGLALGAVLLISALASHLYTRALRRLVVEARELSEGASGERLHVSGADEIGQLTGSINRMSEVLHKVVSSLASERDRFEAVLEGMADGVLALDQDRQITHINSAALEMLKTEGSPVGNTLLETIRAAPLHEMLDEVKPAQVGIASFDLPGEPRRKIQARAATRPSGEGVVVLQDVTDLRRLETIRRDFVANVSHELRTPVSIIRANAETLLAGASADPERAEDFLQALHRNAERLSVLISDLLDISRLESGDTHLTISAVDLNNLAPQICRELSPAAAEKNIQLTTQIEPGAVPQADETALHQVLTNLIDNAIKYNPAKGRVKLTARCLSDRVRIEISDDGPGIEPKLRERVFERFFRVDKGRSRERGGTGLGLSIVKNLVETMDGQVGFLPNQPKGSIFWCDLPRAEV